MDTRYYSSIQEKRIAKLLDGKVVANSGATKFNKGDVRCKNLLVECKTNIDEKKSFTIKKEWLIKNKEEAFQQGISNSIIAFSFGDGEDYFIIDKKLMLKLKEILNNGK